MKRIFTGTRCDSLVRGTSALALCGSLLCAGIAPAHGQDVPVLPAGPTAPAAPPQSPMDARLIAAVNAQNAASVQRLLQAGADVNAVGPVGDGKNEFFPGNDTPALVIAVCLHDIPTLKTLIRYGGNVWRKNVDQALFIAACFGNLGAVRLFLDNGVSASTEIGGTPVLVAAAESPAPGQEKIVALLLDKGAPIDAAVAAPPATDPAGPVESDSEEVGATALMLAAANGNLKTTRLLIARGADCSLKDAAGKTALDHAREAQRDEIAALLERAASHRENVGRSRELVQAVHDGDAVRLQAVLQGKGDPNARNDAGETLLIMAARSGKTALIDILLQHGAQIDLPDLKDHYTALIRAAEGGKTDAARLLIRQHADLEAHLRYYSRTALTSAAIYDHLPIVQALVEAGANVNARDDSRTTPLMEAANYGKTDIVRYLLDHGADRDAVDDAGLSALAMARRNGFTETVAALISAGAKP